MKEFLLLLLAASSMSGCTVDMKISPQIPPPSGARKWPLTVAVYVPPAVRQIGGVEEIQNPCIGALGPSPEGEVFAQTVEGVLRNSFEKVVSVAALPAPSDANIVVEAVMTRIAIKSGCGISPDIYAVAEGTFRALGADGQEVWRSGQTSARADAGLEANSYDLVTPTAMARLAAAWANDLSVSSLTRGSGEMEAAAPAAVPAAPPAKAEKQWWEK